jgi:hypothetical protein
MAYFGVCVCNKNIYEFLLRCYPCLTSMRYGWMSLRFMRVIRLMGDERVESGMSNELS